MEAVSLILVMLVVVLASSMLSRMLPASLPVTLPLLQIILGAVVGLVSDWRLQLDPQIFFLLFLPPLLFLDGWRIPKECLAHERGLVMGLAVGLVVFTVLGAGYFIHWLLPVIPLGVAFALAAVISPTDPVAVSAIAARVPVPKRLMNILEGESLLNDASGLVCLRFAVAAVLTGNFALSEALLDFFHLALGGIIIGALIAWFISFAKLWVSKHFGEDTAAQILISLLLPFMAYLAAEHFHCSGILAAVAAGFVMSRTELSGQVMAITRLQRQSIWDTLKYALNGLMFVLLGEQLPTIIGQVGALDDLGTLLDLLGCVLLINLALLVLRFIWVLMSLRFTLFAGNDAKHFTWFKAARISLAMSVAGVRGAISLAGIMTLPLYISLGYPFPARDLAVFLATGVIIMSLVLAGMLLPWLVKNLLLPHELEADTREERALDQAAEAAIQAIEKELHKVLHASARENSSDVTSTYMEIAARVTDSYRERIEGHAAPLETQQMALASAEIERKLLLIGLHAERNELFRLARTKRLGELQTRKLVRRIDLIEAQYLH
ncbi:Na+/H+ antiporter [Azomonas macrocytogenes]|uniref:CPA1 family monovalent cation:H+ antiporter n=1 Tax=Azomonas macrocytogenes TaxID=69962 RepID=A0A839T0T0_AZOMA|nr:Na+/H+ antiporter [Azomonas macrocytogenes]MBB3102150.1 CPA1 family monovalent cation:H+ antiporter [Azomonas macrocytogenes]